MRVWLRSQKAAAFVLPPRDGTARSTLAQTFSPSTSSSSLNRVQLSSSLSSSSPLDRASTEMDEACETVRLIPSAFRQTFAPLAIDEAAADEEGAMTNVGVTRDDDEFVAGTRIGEDTRDEEAIVASVQSSSVRMVTGAVGRGKGTRTGDAASESTRSGGVANGESSSNAVSLADNEWEGGVAQRVAATAEVAADVLGVSFVSLVSTSEIKGPAAHGTGPSRSVPVATNGFCGAAASSSSSPASNQSSGASRCGALESSSPARSATGRSASERRCRSSSSCSDAVMSPRMYRCWSWSSSSSPVVVCRLTSWRESLLVCQPRGAHEAEPKQVGAVASYFEPGLIRCRRQRTAPRRSCRAPPPQLVRFLFPRARSRITSRSRSKRPTDSHQLPLTPFPFAFAFPFPFPFAVPPLLAARVRVPLVEFE